jgi:hypothetical protein
MSPLRILRGLFVMLTVLGFTLVAASIVQATSPTAASGTFADSSVSDTVVHQADGNLVISEKTLGQFTGTFAGAYTEETIVIVRADGSVEFQGVNTCVCTVGGQSTTLYQSFAGVGDPTGACRGQWVILRGTGDLSNLRGEGTFACPSGSNGAFGTYAGQMR